MKKVVSLAGRALLLRYGYLSKRRSGVIAADDR